MTTSVIVVAHRPHRWLAESLASAQGEADEVVLVDNGSDEEAVTSQGRRSGVTVVRLPQNVGFPGGVNAGLRVARGDLLALLNDDAFAEPGWLAAAAAALADESVAAVGPKILFAFPHAELRFDDDGHHIGGDHRLLGRRLSSVTVAGEEALPRLLGPGIHPLEAGVEQGRPAAWRWTAGRDPIFVPLPPGASGDDVAVDGVAAPVVRTVDIVNNAGSYLSAHGYGGDYGLGSPDNGSFDEPADRFALCGAAWVTRAETVRRVGPMVAWFFAYYEDLDWCWRAQLHGLRLRYDPAGVVRHVGGVTSGGPLSVRVRHLAGRNRFLCLARNAPIATVGGELRRARRSPAEPLPAARLPVPLARALVERRLLARGWSRSPEDVWRQWAGVNERWPGSAAG